MSKTLVWIGGNTYPCRAEIKADGFKWSAKKRMWWMPITEYMSHLNPVTDDNDHAIIGTASDGTPVVVAECHHIDGMGDDGYTDLAGRLDYDLGY
jgi:hypothetical protein